MGMGKDMRKIKVLRLIARVNIGGPAQNVVFLTEGLDNRKYDSSLIYGSVEKGEGDMSYLVKERNIKHIFIPEFTRKINFLNDIKSFVKIVSIMRREKPDIVHTHTAKAGTLGRVAAMLARVPVKVHTYHGHIFHGYFGKSKTLMFLFIERILSRFTDRIIAISENQRQELLNTYKIGSAKKFTVVNLGFEMNRFLKVKEKTGSFRQKYNLKNSDILIGVIGRLVPVKNHKMLIRVASSLKRSLPEDIFNKVRFVIIGDGPLKSSLMEYAESKSVLDNLLFCGWLKDVEEAYADLDIIALTSKNEGTPLSLIEASASSKPIISTDVGGVRDILGDDGILVANGDEEMFSARLAELIKSDHKRKEIGERGKDRVLRRFSKENLIRNVEKLYGELLLEKGILE